MILPILLFFEINRIASAGTITSANSGSWNTSATWIGGVVPASTDNVIITEGIAVTLATPKSITNFTINNGGTLNDAGFNLTVSGNLVINGIYNGNGTGRLLLNGNGNTIDGAGTINNINRMSLAASGTISILATANLGFTGANQLISLFSNNTITNYGTVTVGRITGVSGTTSVWLNASNAVLNIKEDLLTTGLLTANASGNTINYSGVVAQTIKATTYFNLTLSNTSIKTAGGALSVNGNFSIGSGSSFDAGAFTHNIGGNFSNNGVFTSSTSEIILEGPSTQSIFTTNGTNTSFYDLYLNKSGNNVILNVNVTIDNTFFLANGAVDLNGYVLTLNNGVSSAISRTNGYIISENPNNSGKLRWNMGSSTGDHLFPFGTSGGAYIPFTFNLTEGTIGNVTVSTYPTGANNCPLPSSPVVVTEANDPSNVVDRFWQIDKDGVSGTANMTFTYANNEVPEKGEEELQAQRWNGISWDAAIGGQISDASANTVSVTGVSAFSPWALAKKAAPLPIELLSFSASWNRKILNLNWETLSEMNNNYFTVERSGDAIVFDELAQVTGSGNSNVLVKYSLSDDDPFSGTSYYRLKQTDYDGKMKYSEIITIKNCSEEVNELDIYPNPSGGIFTLCFKGDKTKICSIEIYNLLGEKVYYSDRYQSTIDLSGLMSGTYFLYFNLTSEIMMEKLMIEI